jgi:hypothetical protein
MYRQSPFSCSEPAVPKLSVTFGRSLIHARPVEMIYLIYKGYEEEPVGYVVSHYRAKRICDELSGLTFVPLEALSPSYIQRQKAIVKDAREHTGQQHQWA